MFVYIYIYVITLLLPIQPICKIVCLIGSTRLDILALRASLAPSNEPTLTTLNLLRKEPRSEPS